MKANLSRYALVGAVLCALLAAWANWEVLRRGGETQQVLVAVKEIQPFTPIPADAVALKAVPKGSAPPDALTSPEALQQQFSRTLLVPDDVIRAPHLVAAAGSNLAARLSADKSYGKRAMALQVNAATGVAGTLREGDPVDILVAIQGVQSKNGGNSTMSKVIARRVPVLLVQTSKDGALGGGNQTTVVLEVTPEKAEEIAFAQAQGMIWLLTGPYEAGNVDEADTAGVNIESFLAKYRGAAVTTAAEPARR